MQYLYNLEEPFGVV